VLNLRGYFTFYSILDGQPQISSLKYEQTVQPFVLTHADCQMQSPTLLETQLLAVRPMFCVVTNSFPSSSSLSSRNSVTLNGIHCDLF